MGPHVAHRTRIDVPSEQAKTKSRIVDLDVDIGADAVDYKYVRLRLPLPLLPSRSVLCALRWLLGCPVCR